MDERICSRCGTDALVVGDMSKQPTALERLLYEALWQSFIFLSPRDRDNALKAISAYEAEYPKEKSNG